MSAILVSSMVTLVSAAAPAGDSVSISLEAYRDKVYASWVGQCVGNMHGFDHEFKYAERPRIDPVEDWEEKTLGRIREVNGAFSDDDTDIEYVELFCMEQYGPEPTYEELAAVCEPADLVRQPLGAEPHGDGLSAADDRAGGAEPALLQD